jgi:tetratricopeptide (TPR) repeat protein
MDSADPVSVSYDALRALERLDRGEFRDAIERLGTDPADADDPASLRWRAEVLLYRDRLDDVAALADALVGPLDGRLDEDSAAGSCARRRALVAAEVAYFRGEYDRATELAESVAHAAETVGDGQHALRATFDLGRILRRRGEYATSLETLLIASHMAARAGNAFYEGMIGYNRAICCYELSDLDRTTEYADASVAKLAESEGLRFLALCRNLRGLVLTELGEAERGMQEFDEAERTASSLGIVSDMLSIANNAARALIAAQKYEDAERRLAALVGADDAPRPFELFYTLCLLSIAQAGQGNVRESRRSAQRAHALAEAAGSDEDRFESALLLLRARSVSGDEEAVAALRAAVERADAVGTEHQRAQARIFLAQALVSDSPIEATNLCREVRDEPAVAQGSWLHAELERVTYQLERAPIRVDEQDRLVIDVKLSWPTIQAAREAAERFIYEHAMSATRGNASAAGRLIGESRCELHRLGRNRWGEARRASGSQDPEAAAKKPIRRRSRIQFS